MLVNEDNKTLYHIQSVHQWSEDPTDLFIYADHDPTEAEIRKIIIEDGGYGDDEDGDMLNEIVANAETYTVWPYTI